MKQSDSLEEAKAHQSKALTQSIGSRASRSIPSPKNTAAAPIPSSIRKSETHKVDKTGANDVKL